MPVDVDGRPRLRRPRIVVRRSGARPAVSIAALRSVLVALLAGLAVGLALHFTPTPPDPPPPEPQLHFVQTVRDDDALGLFDRAQERLDLPGSGPVEPSSRRLAGLDGGTLFATAPAPAVVCAALVTAGRRTTWCETRAAFLRAGLVMRFPARQADVVGVRTAAWRPDGRVIWTGRGF